MEAVGIGFVAFFARLSGNAVFVVIKLLYALNGTFPYGVVIKLFHRIGFCVPAVEIADNADRRRMGRPDTEDNLVLICKLMRAEKFICLGVLSLMKKVKRNFMVV